MDIFRLTNPGESFYQARGEILNDIREKLWVERYRDAGEFKLVAPVSSGLRESLPIGSFVSHMQTEEVMIVEDHQIDEEEDTDPDVVVTGRGFETFLDNRIVGINDWSATDPSLGYTLAANSTWEQAVKLLEDHVLLTGQLDADNEIPNVEILHTVPDVETGPSRVIERGPLHIRLLELLAVDDLGVKLCRPGLLSPLGPASYSLAMVVHRGFDKRNRAVYSHNDGEIRKATYFWSNRGEKNCAYVTGRWIQLFEDTPLAKYERRMMYIDASDIDSPYQTNPTGSTRALLTQAMRDRAQQVLAAQNAVALANVEITEREDTTVYRVDYNVGDLVGVAGNYDESAVMRVMEFAEIEDENGESGYPTLSVYNEET